MDQDLEQLMQLAMLKRGVMITPFHDTMLVSPQTSAEDCAALLKAFAAVLDGLCRARVTARPESSVATFGVQQAAEGARQRLVDTLAGFVLGQTGLQGSGRGAQQRSLATQAADALGTEATRAAGQTCSRRFKQFQLFQREVGKVLKLGRTRERHDGTS